MGPKHASMLEKILEMRLRVMVANIQDSWLMASAPKPDICQARPSKSWVDIMDTESTVMSPLFDKLDLGELGDKDAGCKPNSDLLNMVEMKKEEDDSTFLPPAV